MRALFAALLLLTACASAEAPIAGEAVAEKATAGETQPVADTAPAAQVDMRCKVDADCAVKNVGNCCGYYPACVNKDSPTFPDRVKAECASQDMMSICGFQEPAGCACVDGQCASTGASQSGGGELK